MDEFDIYEDLELLHELEKKEATDDLKWKDKYEVALHTIQKLQAEKKELNKKVKLLETNFASLFETARTEIKRKDKLICELRKQKDDICFRRTKPQTGGRQLNEDAHVRRAASSESIQMNPFKRDSRIENPSNEDLSKKYLDDKHPSTSSKEQIENEKRLFDKANFRENVPRNISHESDPSRDRHGDRSRDRSRHRNRSRNRLDVRTRYRDDRNDTKHRSRLEDRRPYRSKERSSQKDDRNNDTKRKRHGRDETKSSDSNSDKAEQSYDRSQRINYINEDKNKTFSDRCESTKLEEKPKDACKSTNDQTIHQHSKIEANRHQNDPSPINEKRVNPKIEILQIEILKDVKELKKNKLKAEKIAKPDPIDPAKVVAEKSNQLLEALFDDSLLNKVEESSMPNYLLDSTHKTDSISDNKKENHIEKDENFNLNFQTPKRKSPTKLFVECFDSSPSGNLFAKADSLNSAKSVKETSSDTDFIPIMKPQRNQNDAITLPIVEEIVIDDSCSENDTTINKECFQMKPPKNPVTVAVDSEDTIGTGKLDDDLSEDLKKTDSNASKKKLRKTDDNWNVKHLTPQKQLVSKLLDDLFGPSPGGSICDQKNSVTSMDESSSDFYFESITKPVNSGKDEKAQAVIPSNAIVDNSTDNVISNNVKCLDVKESKQHEMPSSTENTANADKDFKFVELDSSFYSSDDYDLQESLHTSRVEVESPVFENITPAKHIQELEARATDKTNAFNDRTEKNNSEEKKYYKPSLPENQKEPRTSNHSSERRHKHREELCQKDHSKKRSNSSKYNRCSHNSNSRSGSEEEPHKSNSFRTEKEKKHRHHHHHHHHHHRHHKHRSKESTHAKSDSSTHRVSRNHSKNLDRHPSTRNRNETKNHSLKEKSDSKNLKNVNSEARSSPMLVYYDDDHVKDVSQNQKTADPDQVFFLLCDDISDDDDIFGETSYSDENKKLSIDNGEPKNENKEEKESTNGQNLEGNLIAIDSTDVSSSDKNKTEINQETEESEITNNVKSNTKDMESSESNDKLMNSIIPLQNKSTAEIVTEPECIVVSLEEEPQDKDVIPNNSSSIPKEAPSFRIEENPSNAICCSAELEKIDTPICDIKQKTNNYASGNYEEVCNLNAAAGINDQQFSEDRQLQKFQKTSEKEDDFTKSLNESKEQEKLEIRESESDKDEQIAHENINEADENMDLHKNCQEIQNMTSLEVDLKDHQKHSKGENAELINSLHSVQSSSNYAEHNKNTNVPNKSIPEENNEFDILHVGKIEKRLMSNGSDDIFCNNVHRRGDSQQILNDEKPISDENLETSLKERINSESSSVIPETNGTEELSHQITNQISTQELISCSTTYQNVSHSKELFCSPVSSQKSLNSADEVESSFSNSELVSSGRRKKIKTPRKRTDVFKNSSTRTMGMVSDRYIKSDGHNDISIQYASVLSSHKVPPKIISPNEDLSDAKREQNCTLDKSPQEEHKSIDENKPESASKKIRCDLDKEMVDKNSLSPLFSEKFLEQVEMERQHSEGPAQSLSKTGDTPLSLASKMIPDEDQQYTNSRKDKDGLQTSFPQSTTGEDQVNNTENLAFIQLDIIEKLHKQTAMLEEVEKESAPRELTSGNSLHISELNEIKKKGDKKKEKDLEPFSIKIKRNRHKRNKIIQLTGIVETILDEVVDDTNKTPFPDKSIEDQTHGFTIKEKNSEEISNNETSETTCIFSFNKTLNSSVSPSEKTKQKCKQQPAKQNQMMKHFMDSKDVLVGTCNYPSVTNSEEVVDIKDCDFKNKISSPTSEIKDEVKRRYKQKIKQILDSCKRNEEPCVTNSSINEESKIVSNDDNNQRTSRALEHFKSPDLQEPRKKRKYKKKNANNSLDSKNKSNEMCEMLEDPENPTSQLNNSLSNEGVDVTNSITNDESKTVPNDDDYNENTSRAVEHFKSPDLQAPTKKRKYKKKNANNSLDSTNKSNELRKMLTELENTSSRLDSSQSNEDVSVTSSSTNDELNTVSNDDDHNQNLSRAFENFKSPDLKAPIKKRKYKKKSANNSLDSKNKSNELCEMLTELENTSSRLDSSQSNEDVSVTSSSTNDELNTVSNDDDHNQNLSRAFENFKSPDLKAPIKKRKYKKKNANNSLDSTEKSNELCEMLEEPENQSSQLDSSQSNGNEEVDITDKTTNDEAKTVSIDDGNCQNTSRTVEHFKSPDLQAPIKKRKYKKKKTKSSLDSINKSNESYKSLEGRENPTSPSQLESESSDAKILHKLHCSKQTGENVDAVNNFSNEVPDLRFEKCSSDLRNEEFCDNTQVSNPIDCSLNNPLFGEEKEHDSYDIKPKKTKKQNKRKLSLSPDAKSEETFVKSKRSKNTLENTPQFSINEFETLTSAASGNNHVESKKEFRRSPSLEKSISVELTPTHHKIFLNDVSPNDPPPVYNANEDDFQYHEIDDRLRSMFQSPSYTHPASSDCTFDEKSDDIDTTTTENVGVDETLNQSECKTSTSSRKVSLGSNEYVIESIGSHTANVFITRKKIKKRTKVVATAVD